MVPPRDWSVAPMGIGGFEAILVVRRLERPPFVIFTTAFSEHAVSDARHLLHLSLSRLETRLDSRRFVRVHRTHIVNLDQVRASAETWRRSCSTVHACR